LWKTSLVSLRFIPIYSLRSAQERHIFGFVGARKEYWKLINHEKFLQKHASKFLRNSFENPLFLFLRPEGVYICSNECHTGCSAGWLLQKRWLCSSALRRQPSAVSSAGCFIVALYYQCWWLDAVTVIFQFRDAGAALEQGAIKALRAMETCKKRKNRYPLW